MTRRFRWLASGDLLCDLPASLDLEVSRRALAAILGQSAHRVHFLDRDANAPTPDEFRELQYDVVVCANFRIRCQDCGVILFCDCERRRNRCVCADSPVTNSKLLCGDCEPSAAWSEEEDDAAFNSSWPWRAFCVVCASSRCRCSVSAALVRRRRGGARRPARLPPEEDA